MPILSGIFKSSEKSLNKVESEISNENIKVVSVENIEKLKDDNKSLLSELIPIAKTKKSNQCFQLHTYDNVYIRRVIHPIKEEVPKMERRKSLKNELFKNLRINTIISGIKGSLNSAPVKEDNKNNKNSSKNGPKTAALEKNFENLKIDEEDESESQTLLNNSNNNSDNSNTNNDNNNNNNSDNNNSNNSDNNNNNNSDNDTNNKSDNNNNNNSNNNNNYSNNSSMILSETDIDMNQSLNRLSEENLKYIDKKQHEGVKSTSTISKTNNDSLSVIHENEITINSINEIDRNMSYHSDNDLPKKKENKVELTIDTSQPKEKKKKKLYTILTPSSKSLPWLKEKKKSKKNEIVSASVLENKDVNSPLNENKSQSGHHSANTFNSNQSSATSITLINSGGISNDNRYSDMEDGGNTPSSTTSSNNETPIKSPKKKKLYFNKEGMVIEKVDATDIRIVSKMYNEYKEDFHKRVEFDFICTEYRKKASYNYYLYSPTDLIYNDSKAFFFYEPTISIGSLKDILKNSKGFKDEMDIYVEEMLCTFKKLVNVVNWLHSTYQIVHRRIEPSRILFDTSGQFKLTGLEWAFHLRNHENINVQEEYNFHEALIHSFNNNDKNEPIFFAPEICELNSDYFSKISTKIDVYSCGMILAAMNFGYSQVSSVLIEQEQQKKYCLNNNFSYNDDVKLIKHSDIIPDIMQVMLKWKPYERISLREVIETKWFSNINVCYPTNDVSIIDLNKTDDEIIHTHLNIPGQKCKSITV